MAATFTVGTKVEHRTWGAGEIAYGPFLRDGHSDNYLMKQTDGEHRFVETDGLAPASKFKVGDKVKGIYSGAEYTVEAGPFFNPSEWYATKGASGYTTNNRVGALLPVEPAKAEPAKDEPIKVGDVVRISRDNLQGADVKEGDLLAVTHVSGSRTVVVKAAPGARNPEWYFDPKNVEKVSADKAAAHNGVVFDLTAKYRDGDGDYWTFKRVDGEVRGEFTGGPFHDIRGRITEYSRTLASAVDAHGPLTKV